MRNLPLTFDCMYSSQKLEEDFVKFCGLLRIYELYIAMLSWTTDELNNFTVLQYSVGDITRYHQILVNQVTNTHYFRNHPSHFVGFVILLNTFLYKFNWIRDLKVA